MAPPTARPPPWISARMLADPWCFQLWGGSRVGINRAAWELAERVNPEYVWLDITGPEDDVDPEEPVASGLVPPQQLYKMLDPTSLKPDHPTANLAMWLVYRPSVSPQKPHPLMDFLRLPPVIQEIIGRSATSGRHGAAVVANADRIAQFYPDEAESITPLLNVWRHERVSLISTFFDLPRKSRTAHDYTFEVRGSAGSGWKSCTVTLERAPPGEDLRAGTTFPLLAN